MKLKCKRKATAIIAAGIDYFVNPYRWYMMIKRDYLRHLKMTEDMQINLENGMKTCEAITDSIAKRVIADEEMKEAEDHYYC